MRKLAFLFLLLFSTTIHATASHATATYAATNKIIRHPTDSDCSIFMVWKETRGGDLKTMRAVLDVLHNRMYVNKTNACKELKKAGQYPYFKYGVYHIHDKEFLTKYKIAVTMSPVLDKRYLFFNTKKHRFATGHVKIGKMWFSRLKERK